MEERYIHSGLRHLAKAVLGFILHVILGIVFISMTIVITKLIVVILMLVTLVIAVVEGMAFVSDILEAHKKTKKE